MIKKNIILISLIFFLTNCGFTPIYLKNNNVNFSIEQVNYTGDRELNNFLKTNLSKYKNKKNENKIYVDIESKYEKIILSKDGAGEVSNYQLKAEVIFLIKSTNKKIKIIEKSVMKSISDKFEEESNETSIKENFASSISYKFASELISNL
jgi:outer membrane lipopolysaccharide assembly protein LptE/RlpB